MKSTVYPKADSAPKPQREKKIKYRHKEASMEEVKQIELRNYTGNLTRNLGVEEQLGGALQRRGWQAKLDKHTRG